MWSGPIHNNGFISKVLEHLESNQSKYSTSVRMKGMLTVAKEVRLKTVIVLKLKLISGYTAGAARPVLLYTIPHRGLFPLDLPPFGRRGVCDRFYNLAAMHSALTYLGPHY